MIKHICFLTQKQKTKNMLLEIRSAGPVLGLAPDRLRQWPGGTQQRAVDEPVTRKSPPSQFGSPSLYLQSLRHF
jgi:hypothetical protein